MLDGRYGPYVKYQKINATIPKDVEPSSVTLEMAVDLIAKKKASKKSSGRKKSTKAKKKSTSKSTAKSKKNTATKKATE